MIEGYYDDSKLILSLQPMHEILLCSNLVGVRHKGSFIQQRDMMLERSDKRWQIKMGKWDERVEVRGEWKVSVLYIKYNLFIHLAKVSL